MQIRGQPVERPAREGQVEILGRGQAGGDHGPKLLGRIRWRSADPWRILQSRQTLGVVARDPVPHSRVTGPDQGDDLADAMTFVGQPTDAGTIAEARLHLLPMGQGPECAHHLLGQRAKQQELGHGEPPLRGPHRTIVSRLFAG